MFEDRSDAGKKLAQALLKYKGKDVIILAIPRGRAGRGKWYFLENALDPILRKASLKK